MAASGSIRSPGEGHPSYWGPAALGWNVRPEPPQCQWTFTRRLPLTRRSMSCLELMTRLLVGMNLCDGSPLGQRQSPFPARLQIGDAKQQTHPIGSARSAITTGPVRFWCRTDRCAQQNSTDRCAQQNSTARRAQLSGIRAGPSEHLAPMRPLLVQVCAHKSRHGARSPLPSGALQSRGDRGLALARSGGAPLQPQPPGLHDLPLLPASPRSQQLEVTVGELLPDQPVQLL